MTGKKKNALEGELSAHLRHLCSDIGARPVGSANNQAAAAYVRSVFSSAGLKVHEQRFDWVDWKAEKTSLQLDGLSLKAYANTYSRSCNVIAPTVAVGTLAELEAADLRGKIGVLYGELTQTPLTPKNFALYTVERDQRIVALLERKQPLALLTVNLQPPSTERLIEDRDFAIPSATVTAEIGLKLVERAGDTVHLLIIAHSSPSCSANVIGTKAGSRPERIVLCAHYDTKIDTPGASDNASGMAALLTLARILSRRNIAAGLEFVAFSDEEYFGQDDAAYVRDSGDQMGTILAAINMDAIGQALGANTVAIMSHSVALHERVSAATAQYPGVIWVDPWPQSNHSTFAWRGVPSIAFTSYFAGMNRYIHLPADTPKWISSAKLAQVVTLVTEIVESIQHESLAWARPSS